MIAADCCRTYIVYHHGLFAQGLRSLLEAQHAVKIVGMGSDVPRALKAVQSLQPEVIIVEECAGKRQPMRLGAFLNGAVGGRVVTLGLGHNFATVYQRNRIAMADPAELVRAIQGVGKPHVPGPEQHPGKIAMAELLISGLRRDDDQSDQGPQGRRTRKPEATIPNTFLRPVRGKVKRSPTRTIPET